MSCPRPATAVRVATCALVAGLTGGAIVLPAEYAAARTPLTRAAGPVSADQTAKSSSAGESSEEFEGFFGEGEEEEVIEGTSAAGPTGTSANAVGVSGEGPAAKGGSAGEAGARISSLKLVRASASALSHRAVQASEIRFGFTLSANARVRARLARASSRAGEVRWHALPDTITLSGVRGLNRARLHGGNALSAGEYRLTLAVARGGARSILIRVS